MIHLLSTQGLIDILCGRDQLTDWMKSIAASSVEVSVVSVGQVISTINEISNPTRRKAFEYALDGFVSAMKISDSIISLDEDAARIWADLKPMTLRHRDRDGRESELSQPSRMVLATALARGAELVEEPQPYHRHVTGLRTYWP